MLFIRNKFKGDEKQLFIGGKNGDLIDNYFIEKRASNGASTFSANIKGGKTASNGHFKTRES
jgi:hypothetical protein